MFKSLEKIIFFVIISIMISCECQKCEEENKIPKTKEQIKAERLQEYSVKFLFEIEGVKVFSFYTDREHYFTTNGTAITTDSYKSGKATHYRDSNIETKPNE